MKERDWRRERCEGFSAWKEEGDLLHRAPFITDEEQYRDELITDLLETYVEAYEYKTEQNRGYRATILWTCVSVIVLFAIVLALLPFQVMERRAGLSMSDVVAFMTASVSFLTLVVGVLHIVTKYVFPENDEEYITRIVKSIQENDLKNRKETAKHRQPDGGTGCGPEPERVSMEPIPPEEGL